jgi:serine/threonine protein phosphatase PrpC
MGSPRAAPNGGAVARTHVGLVRETNEDTVYVGARGRLLACADGLGGLPWGEVASRVAVEHAVTALGTRLAESRPRASRSWPHELRSAFLGAHEAVLAAGRKRGAAEGIATTMVVAIVTARSAHVCHVGDVRAYLSAGGRLQRLTDDHSVVFDAVRAGAMTVEEARVHPRRNLVTQAIGLAEGVAPSTATARIAVGDTLLLCSDGLWETLSEAELAHVLDPARDPHAIADSLIEHALDAGGPDNVSAVVYRHRPWW